MPSINRFADFHKEITARRHEIHQNPELLFDVNDTAALVEKTLKSFCVDEVVMGLGRIGVVGDVLDSGQ